MIRLPRSPGGRGAIAFVGVFLAVLGVALPWMSRREREQAARAQALAATLADAARARAEDGLQACRRTTRLLADQVGPLIEAAGDLSAGRTALVAAQRAFPENLRGAVVASGDGRVLAASDPWREGTRPDWLSGGSGEAGAFWLESDSWSRIVAREGMVAPPTLPAPLWMATLWDVAAVTAGLDDLARSQPDATWVLETRAGEALLRLPPGRPDPDRAAAASLDLGSAGLRVRARVPGPAPQPLLPWAVAAAAAAVAAGGVAAAGASRQRERLRVAAAIDRLRAEGGAVAAAGSPEIGEALRRLQQQVVEARGREESVRAALERLRGGVVLVTDASGSVEIAAGESLRVLGEPEASVVGRSLRRLLGAAAWEALAPALARAGLEGEGATLEVDLTRAGGAAARLELNVTGRDRGGGYVLLARDITASHRRRRELEEAGSLHRELVGRMGDGVAVVRDGRLESVNPALAEILGRRPEEVTGAPLKQFVASRDVLMLIDRLRRADEESGTFDLALLRADALEPRDASATLAPLPGGAALLVVRDLTERRRAERLAADAARRLHATLAGITDGVLAIEPRDGMRVAFANRAFAELTGVPEADVIGGGEDDALRRLGERGILPGGFAAWAGERRRDLGATARERFDAPHGRVIEVVASPLEFPGRATGRLFVFRDVTAEAEAERRLRQDHDRAQAHREVLEAANREMERVNRELEARSAELRQVNARLQQLDEMRANLLANVTHELQTPLVSIRGYTEMILRGKIGPITVEQARGLEISLRNIDRLIGLIDNLVEMSRGEEGLPALRLGTFRLRDLLEEVLDLLQEPAARRGVRLQASYPGGDPLLRGDRDRIAQVLINVVENGIKFNREGGRVEIEVGESRQGFARLQVRDTGPGIPPDDLERIFDRHYRAAQPAGEGVEGRGLGLSICRQILRLHGCTIRAANAEGGGAILSLSLPLAREGERPDGEGEIRRRASTGAAS